MPAIISITPMTCMFAPAMCQFTAKVRIAPTAIRITVPPMPTVLASWDGESVVLYRTRLPRGAVRNRTAPSGTPGARADRSSALQEGPQRGGQQVRVLGAAELPGGVHGERGDAAVHGGDA